MTLLDSTVERVEHLWILALALIALLGSFLLQPSGNNGLCVTVPIWGNRLVVPDTCLSRTLLGISCPGCGLTRSFAAMARGEVCAAFRLNLCGPILFIICCFQIPYRIIAYFNVGRAMPFFYQIEQQGDLITWFIAAGLIATWLARLAWELWTRGGSHLFLRQLF
jgi:hypothetical protein